MAQYFTELTVDRPPHLGGGKWTLRQLNEITIIFGKNGSGKSQLLRNLRDTNPSVFHYAAPERMGDINHDVGIMQEELIASSRANRRKGNLARTFRQEAVSRIQALLVKAGYSAGRSISTSINLSDIEAAMGVLLPDFLFTITPGNPPFEFKRVTGEKITSTEVLSSGESEILTIALDLLTICALWESDKQAARVLLVDEPDTHLHPDLQQHLASFLSLLVRKYKVQIIIATHSTTLLAALGRCGGNGTSVLYLNNAHTEQKSIRFDDALQELTACLGGHVLMGPLFGAPLLLVEGDDDYKIWSDIPRYHHVKLAAVPCHGAGNVCSHQKKLEGLFENLRSDCSVPIGYALLDGDQTIPTSHSQKHIRFLQLACKASENLYLTNEVLAKMDTDWEKAKEKLKQGDAKFMECEQWDRKHHKPLKDVMLEMSRILDPQQLPWTLRVAQCLGVARPQAELADFLGQEIVDALWPLPVTETS